jgi:hypothetical protein
VFVGRALCFRSTAVYGSVECVSVVLVVMWWRGVDLVRSKDDNVPSSDVEILVPFEIGFHRTLHLVAEERMAFFVRNVQVRRVDLGEPVDELFS